MSKEILNLYNFLVNNNFNRQANLLRKFATPFFSDAIPKSEESKMIEKTKSIIPKIYFAENIDEDLFYDELERKLNKLFSDAEDKDLESAFARDVTYFIYSIIEQEVTNFRTENTIQDFSDTKTTMINKEDFIKFLNNIKTEYQFYEEDIEHLSKKRREAAVLLHKESLKIGVDIFIDYIKSFPEGYDFYFMSFVNLADFTTSKEFIYHDFLGHGFYELFKDFSDKIETYFLEIVKLFDITKAMKSMYRNIRDYKDRKHKVHFYFTLLFGIKDLKEIFNIEKAVYDETQNSEDSFLDLYSLILQDKIKVNSLNIPKKHFEQKNIYSPFSAQDTVDALSKKLEQDLNEIKDKMTLHLNDFLRKNKNNNLILQVV